ncbi:MAG: hypothetical protein IKV75_00925 [Bacteroidales bacterium]|nr:hypothetical protein [Bacteroidales bacterium]
MRISYLGKTVLLFSILAFVYLNAEARKVCESLPYNRGMVDVNLLDGIFLTEKGGSYVG